MNSQLVKERISLTIDENLAGDIDQYYRKILKEALNRNEKKLPKLASLYEDIIRMGWENYKKKEKIAS